MTTKIVSMEAVQQCLVACAAVTCADPFRFAPVESVLGPQTDTAMYYCTFVEKHARALKVQK